MKTGDVMKKVIEYKNWYEDFKVKLIDNKTSIETIEIEVMNEKKKLKQLIKLKK